MTGRARTAGDSFSFALTAADETTQEAVTNGTVSGAVCASNCTAESILASATSTNVTAESGESRSFEFTQLTFGKAGTYTFNVAEQSGNAGGIIYDTHISTVTYVISDTDANGKHTGRLNVAKVSYSNATATTEADRKVTDAAAFTNAYHATATFAGLTVTKELHNRNAGTTRNLYAGEFTFTISGDDEASAQRISAGTFASDRKFSNGYAAGSEAQSATKYGNAVSGMTKLSNLVFNESDVGKTYRFVVKELAQHTNPNTGAVNTKLDSDSTKLTGETATDVKIDGIWFRQWTYLVSVTVSDNGDGTLNVSTSKSVVKGDGSTSTADDITFVNTYETLKSTEIDDTSASAPLYKQLSGRDWSDSEKDRFTFTVEKCNYSTNAGSFSDASSIVCTSDGTTLSTLPSPSRNSSVTIGKDQVVPTKAGNFAKIGFGSFSFSKPGAYVYKVTEVAGDDTTLTYAANVRYLRFRVEENQMKGVYSVIVTTPGYDAPTATDANDGAAFVNVCKSVERLPLTGGLTTRNFLVGGFVVGLLAVFAGLGIHEWWNKQRRKEQLLE
ncbi:Spy0128 family protein [Bifidobacterium dentium]|uniref:Spy0128 family protein n=1 Tax=Bifidobacterium dentium TaxID=1689 RepID=UPI0023B88874|nr:FctA domain-containing protein [Bifidobacterium dentium]